MKPNQSQVNWKKCVPFFFNPRGVLVHRIRFATTYLNDGKVRHHSAHYWCGNTGLRGEFLELPLEGQLLCILCEAKAVAFGQPSADQLCGRHIHVGRAKAVQTCCIGHLP
jgi:hypothetical protein